jgi:hypothetical protein
MKMARAQRRLQPSPITTTLAEVTMSKARILSCALIITLVALLTGCTLVAPTGSNGRIAGSGKVVEAKLPALTGFSTIETNDNCQLDVSRADSFSVKVSVDDNLEQYLDVAVSGNKLHIGLKHPSGSAGYERVTLRAQVTLPALAGVNLNGNSDAKMSGFKSAQSFLGDLNGNSKLRGDLEAGTTKLILNGNSQAELSGKVGSLNVEVQGNSIGRLTNLAAGDAEVKVGGNSKLYVKASGKLSGSADGNSLVQYAGAPASVNVKTSGNSTVSK